LTQRGVIEASTKTDKPPWRQHVAIMVAGLRPSFDPLAEPALPVPR
jgi:hypothetical protein